MEDELQGEKIGLMLTVQNPAGLCEEVLLPLGDFCSRAAVGCSDRGGYRVSSVYSGNMSSGCGKSGCLI